MFGQGGQVTLVGQSLIIYDRLNRFFSELLSLGRQLAIWTERSVEQIFEILLFRREVLR